MAAKNSQSAGLRIEQTTKIRLTPEQIQQIHILEFPLLQLEERIQQELIENQALEITSNDTDDKEYDDINNEESNQSDNVNENEDEDASIDNQSDDPFNNDNIDFNDYAGDDDSYDDGGYYGSSSNHSTEHREEIPFSVGPSLQEHLLSQVGMLDINDLQKKIAQYIIGNIDEKGYLRARYDELVDHLAFKANITISDDEMIALIKLIQDTFDPAGIAAYDLKECLLLQLKRLQSTKAVNQAITIIDKKFDDYTAHHFKKIQERYNLTKEEFKQIQNIITKLNPTPASPWMDSAYQPTAIIPDFIIDVDVANQTVKVRLNNDNIPELKVSRSFKDSIKIYESKTKHTKQEENDIKYIKDRIGAANWFISAIKERNENLIRTMRAIVSLQKEYFLTGDPAKIQPMILKDVSKRTNYDESTISRISNGKYAQTPYGIVKLRTFFSESIITEDGREVATKAIKNALVEIIENEDKKHPFNDEKLKQKLKERGYPIARRTVTKYRDLENIPVARLRKSL